MRILVTAGAGHQGKLLIPRLAAAGHRVRAVRITSGKDDELHALGASEVFVGDLSDRDTYAEALKDCDSVYHIGPTGQDQEVQKGLALIEAAKRCGTRHVVMSSCHYSIVDIIQHRAKRDIEEKIYESGLNYTILKPCDFMMTEMHIDPVLSSNALPVWWRIKPGRRGSLICVDDLAEVAAKVLMEGEKHYHAEYDLAGPDKLTADQMARILSRILGREIKTVQWSVAKKFEFRFGISTPTEANQHYFDVMTSIEKWYSQYEFLGNHNVLEWLLGRKPTTFEQYARKALFECGAIKESKDC